MKYFLELSYIEGRQKMTKQKINENVLKVVENKFHTLKVVENEVPTCVEESNESLLVVKDVLVIFCGMSKPIDESISFIFSYEHYPPSPHDRVINAQEIDIYLKKEQFSSYF